jgi:hypothetical protein
MNILKKINIKKALTHNVWLKIISLVIAVVMWVYIRGEIIQGIKL